MGYLIVLMVGLLLGWIANTILNPEKEEASKRELKMYKQKVLSLEAWKETITSSIGGMETMIASQGKAVQKFAAAIVEQEKLFKKYETDYQLVQTELTATNRRYADLVPMHRHYYEPNGGAKTLLEKAGLT